MTQFALPLLGAIALAGASSAQTAFPQSTSARSVPGSAATSQLVSVGAERVPVPTRDAGTFHLATGTWTRTAGSVAPFGLSDNIYSNTSPSGYYTGLIGPSGSRPFAELVDEGVIPGTTNPAVFANGGAVTDFYLVTEVQISYCDFDPIAASSGWTIDFYEGRAPCTLATQPAVGSVVVSGFPSNGCWTMTVDLTNATGTGQEFIFQADGGALNPGFDGDPDLDSFGVSWRYTGTGVESAGPLIAGDPASTDTGWLSGLPSTASNTYFGENGLCPGVGTGYQNRDSYLLEDTQANYTGCYFFGGYRNTSPSCTSIPSSAYGGFFMEMSATWNTTPDDCGICVPGCTGAVTSTGAPADCEISGDVIAANNNALLTASGLPPNQFGLFATGRASTPAMTVITGNGWICIDPGGMGGLGRFMGANQVKNSGPTGQFTLDTNLGEWSLASIPTAMGSYAAMSGVTSHFQAWFREPVGAGFNFSGSTSVTWQ